MLCSRCVCTCTYVCMKHVHTYVHMYDMYICMESEREGEGGREVFSSI